MKKIISIILVCSMLLLGTVTVFATETEADTKNYNLSELFKDYQEKNLSEMVEFISANPYAYGFFEGVFEKPLAGKRHYMFYIHTNAALTGGISTNLDILGFSIENYYNYLLSTARPSAVKVSEYDPLVGEVGAKALTIELNDEFISYINSLDRAEANKLILNFLMNILDNEAVVGVSWDSGGNYIYGDHDGVVNVDQAVMIGDCNGDGMINGADGYLMKIVVAGYVNNNVDPFAVDIDGDGLITSKDSLLLKRKIAIG